MLKIEKWTVAVKTNCFVKISDNIDWLKYDLVKMKIYYFMLYYTISYYIFIQDVLVPWRPLSTYDTCSGDDCFDDDEDEEIASRRRTGSFPTFQTCDDDADSYRERTTISDDSVASRASSSPGETCYSFVRRAIQVSYHNYYI